VVTTPSLKDQLEERIRTIEELTAGVSDEQAGQAPAEGEWCVKEVLSHLAGSEALSFREGIIAFLQQDTPEYDITPGESYFGPDRANASVSDLRDSVLTQYRQIGEAIGGLTEDQLGRKAHMPAFKDTPLTEYPTLGLWVGGIVNYHLPAHIEQLQSLCK
jgi:hypothetical protein